MTVVLHVCMTCRAGQPVAEGAVCPGRRLYDVLSAAEMPDGLKIRPVECLSACDHGCSVALSKPGAWSYVYGRLTEEDAPEILRGAALFAATVDGLVPWRDRPVIFRKQCLARVPPVESDRPNSPMEP
ncbi:MAG: DUF1636 family protein [Paracoccaceae bacterium]